MKTAAKMAPDSFRNDPVESLPGSSEFGMSDDPEQFSEIYKDLAELVGVGNARKIWKVYAGLNITFPQRLYSREYTRAFIAKNYQDKSPRELAKATGLSERRVRQIIREIKSEKPE
ncbi:MAG: Mor transcription activator family protein [Lachnospiraceae bacterium]|jgi:hypothetical protein